RSQAGRGRSDRLFPRAQPAKGWAGAGAPRGTPAPDGTARTSGGPCWPPSRADARADLGHAPGRVRGSNRECVADQALHRSGGPVQIRGSRGLLASQERAALRHVRGRVHPRRGPLHLRDVAPAVSTARARATLREFVFYFLKLGTLGFGGPIALGGYMQRDLVDERGWIAPDDYKQGLALAQLAPGPLAAQLAIYLGWVRGRVLGATLVGIAFVAPSFLMVLALSALFLKLGGLAWMTALFYGIGAAVIAIIAWSAAS